MIDELFDAVFYGYGGDCDRPRRPWRGRVRRQRRGRLRRLGRRLRGRR